MASESFFVYVSTNIDTHLGVVFEANETVLGFKDKFCIEHKRCFESVGEIKISAVKIKWGTDYFLLPDSMIVKKAFDRSIGSKDLFLFLDVFPVVVVDNASEVLKVSKMKKDITCEDVPNEKEGVQVFAQGPAAMNKDDFVSDIIDGALNTESDFGTKVKAVGEDVEAIETATEIGLKEDVVGEEVEAMQTGIRTQTREKGVVEGVEPMEIDDKQKAVGEEKVESVQTVTVVEGDYVVQPRKKRSKKKKSKPATEDVIPVASVSEVVEPCAVMKDPTVNVE